MDKRKKRAAAIAAVMSYLKQEQEAAAMQSMAALALGSALAGRGAPPLKLWGSSGRLAQMQASNLMQMRTFK